MKGAGAPLTQVNRAAVYLGLHEMVVKEVGKRCQADPHAQCHSPSAQRFARRRFETYRGRSVDPFSRWGGVETDSRGAKRKWPKGLTKNRRARQRWLMNQTGAAFCNFNWPWWIRTTIDGSKVRCPAVGRRASGLKPSDPKGAAEGKRLLAKPPCPGPPGGRKLKQHRQLQSCRVTGTVRA